MKWLLMLVVSVSLIGCAGKPYRVIVLNNLDHPIEVLDLEQRQKSHAEHLPPGARVELDVTEHVIWRMKVRIVVTVIGEAGEHLGFEEYTLEPGLRAPVPYGRYGQPPVVPYEERTYFIAVDSFRPVVKWRNPVGVARPDPRQLR